jgi:hypothetical protein
VSFLHFHRREGPGEEEPRRLTPHPSWEAALSGEAEAFLEGRLVEHLVAAGRPVPAWAVLNKLAHASPQELADLIMLHGRSHSEAEAGAPTWLAAQKSLAARLVRNTPVPDEITDPQHQRLIPLELWLIERSKTQTVTPRQVISAASDALDKDRPGP